MSKGYWRKRYVKIRDNLDLVTPISPKTRRCLATMRGGRTKRLNQHKARPPTKRKPSGSGTDTSPTQTNPHKQYRGEHQSIGVTMNQGDMAGMDSGFTANLLQSLSNQAIKEALSTIMTQACAQMLQHIKDLKCQVSDGEKRIAALEAENIQLKKDKSETEYQLHELQQYTRRNALRIVNPAWAEPRNTNEQEDTDRLILDLIQSLGVNLAPWEISRSHRVGKKRNDGTPRPIIVKFIGYNVRRRVYEARKKLKNHATLRRVYINEDLTRQNSRLAYEARQLKKQRVIADTFTVDGRIYVKRFQGQVPKVVRDLEHLRSITNAPTYANTATTEQDQRRSGSTAENNDASMDTTASSIMLPPPMHSNRPNRTIIITSTPAARPGGPVVQSENELPASASPEGATGYTPVDDGNISDAILDGMETTVV